MGFSLKRSIKRLTTRPGKFFENAGRSLGQGAQAVAPFLPPGFREAASIGGSIAAGGNMRDHAMSGVGAYVGSQMGGRQAGQAMASANRAGGVRGVVRALPGIMQPRRPGTGPSTFPQGQGFTFPGFGGGMPFPSQGGGSGGRPWLESLGGLGGLAGKAAGFVKDNALDIAMAGLATQQGLAAAKASARGSKLSDKSLALAEQRWKGAEPLRVEGQRRLLSTERPDLSYAYADPTNPFATPMKRPTNPNASPIVASGHPPNPLAPTGSPWGWPPANVPGPSGGGASPAAAEKMKRVLGNTGLTSIKRKLFRSR